MTTQGIIIAFFTPWVIVGIYLIIEANKHLYPNTYVRAKNIMKTLVSGFVLFSLFIFIFGGRK